MERGIILGKASEKKFKDLNENNKFLNKKRKERDSEENKNYKIEFTNSRRSINLVGFGDLEEELSPDKANDKSSKNINDQLDLDDQSYQNSSKKKKKNKINLIDYDEEVEMRTREKVKFENDMERDDRVKSFKVVDVVKTKSDRDHKRKRHRRDREAKSNSISSPMKSLDSNNDNFEEADNEPVFNRDLIKFSSQPSTEARSSPMTDDSYFCPWLSEKTKSYRGMLKLHYEIIDFYEFIKPTAEEDVNREESVRIMKSVIKEKWPDWKVKKFGSYPNKLHLPDSDVDLVIITDSTSPADQLKVLKKIEKELSKRNIVDYLRLIEARVPIIRTSLSKTKISLDISANRKNGYEAKKVIKKILEDFPYMRPLIYVLKYFLRQRKLNESYTGGISSFLLFNLLFSYIQYLTKQTAVEKLTLGDILVGFFQFYAFDFNFEEVGISIRFGGHYYKKSSKLSYDKRNALLSVENFQELDQDIGKGSFKFRRVLDFFKQARDHLYYPSQHPIVSYLALFITMDDFLRERARKKNEMKTK